MFIFALGRVLKSHHSTKLGISYIFMILWFFIFFYFTINLTILLPELYIQTNTHTHIYKMNYSSSSLLIYWIFELLNLKLRLVSKIFSSFYFLNIIIFFLHFLFLKLRLIIKNKNCFKQWKLGNITWSLIFVFFI